MPLGGREVGSWATARYFSLIFKTDEIVSHLKLTVKRGVSQM